MKKLVSNFINILKLPHVTIKLDAANLSFFNFFNSRHPKYKIIKNKTIGVCIISLKKFSSAQDYLNSINGKNSAFYYRRKALKRGYVFQIIERNHYIDDIYEINTSSPYRQKQEISDYYRKKSDFYESDPNYKYYGVLNSNGKLVAYCWYALCGEVGIVDELLGHKTFLNDGIMYLLITSVIEESFKQNGIKYVSYDMYYGALKGLRSFKEKLGFKPFIVKWTK